MIRSTTSIVSPVSSFVRTGVDATPTMDCMRARDLPYFDRPFAAFAHRGGSLLADNVGRENTLAAFQAAVNLGYTYLETDVHATRDGTLLAFHDHTLDRVTDRFGEIAELPWSAVCRAHVGGEQIPTMDELFETFPKARFNIDLKAAGAVEPLANVLERHNAYDRVCVASFSDARLARFRRIVGGAVATSTSPSTVLLFAKARWATRLFDTPGYALQIPVSTTIAGRQITLVTPRLIAAAHAAGKLVHVWTIDEPQEMQRLIDLGVDGIMSDRPDLLKDVLLERSLWCE